MASLVEIGPVVLEKIFQFFQCIFAISLLSSLGRGYGLLFEKKITLNLLHPRILCAKFAEIDPVVLEQKMKM